MEKIQIVIDNTFRWLCHHPNITFWLCFGIVAGGLRALMKRGYD